MPYQQRPPPLPAGVRQISSPFIELHRMVQLNCCEVSAVAQLTQAWLQTPEGRRNLDVVGTALRIIEHSAKRLITYVEDETMLARQESQAERSDGPYPPPV